MIYNILFILVGVIFITFVCKLFVDNVLLQLHNHRWYRKFRGGTWYYVSFRTAEQKVYIWCRYPAKNDNIIETEKYN